MLSALLAELCLDRQAQRVCLIGHSHVALSFVRREGELATGEPRREGAVLDVAEGEWLLNPGSVGQPRDGDPRASWLLLDLDGQTASFERTEYDVRRCGRRDPCGAPARLARRAPGVRSVTMLRQQPQKRPLAGRRRAPRAADASHAPPARAAWLMRAVPATALGALAALLISCGSSGGGLIPIADAGPLQSDFEAVAQAAETGDGSCASTESALLRTEQDFAALPPSVDSALRETIRRGIDNLRTHALALCAQPLPQSTVTTTPKTTTSTTTSTPPAETQTAPTETQPPPTPSPSGPGGGTPAPGEEAEEESPGVGKGEGAGGAAPGAGAGGGQEAGK